MIQKRVSQKQQSGFWDTSNEILRCLQLHLKCTCHATFCTIKNLLPMLGGKHILMIPKKVSQKQQTGFWHTPNEILRFLELHSKGTCHATFCNIENLLPVLGGKHIFCASRLAWGAHFPFLQHLHWKTYISECYKHYKNQGKNASEAWNRLK